MLVVERRRPGVHAAAPAADSLLAVGRAQRRVVLVQPLHRAVVPLVQAHIAPYPLRRPGVLLVPGHRGQGELTRLVRALQLRRERDVHIRRAEAASSEQLSDADSLYASLHSERHVAPAGKAAGLAVPHGLTVAQQNQVGL